MVKKAELRPCEHADHAVPTAVLHLGSPLLLGARGGHVLQAEVELLPQLGQDVHVETVPVGDALAEGFRPVFHIPNDTALLDNLVDITTVCCSYSYINFRLSILPIS